MIAPTHTIIYHKGIRPLSVVCAVHVIKACLIRELRVLRKDSSKPQSSQVLRGGFDLICCHAGDVSSRFKVFFSIPQVI